MSSFWLIISGLIALAVLMIVVPVIVWRRANQLTDQQPLMNESQQHSRDDQNLRIYNENIAELDQQLSDRVISKEDCDRLKLESRRNLLVDIPEQTDVVAPAGISSTRTVFLIVIALLVVIPSSSIYLYSEWGAADRVAEQQQLLAAGVNNSAENGGAGKRDFSKLADQLEAKLKERPEDITGWLLLAKTRMSLGEHQKAAQIYTILIDKASTNKNRAMAMGLYAQAGFFLAGQRITPTVLQVIEGALQADPNEVTALGLKGVDAFAKSNYPEAVKYWKLAAANTANEENRQTLLRGVAQAQQRIEGASANSSDRGVENLNSSPAKSNPVKNYGSLLVNLSIKPAMREGLDSNLWVYLYAKAVNGPRAPLAANRFKLSELPKQVVLDDSMAMNPNMKVSGFAQLEIVARVSKSGQPLSAKGDLQGAVTLTRKGSSQTGVRLVIDSIVP